MTKLFLLRVDDFPAWEESMDRFVPAEDFEKFHAVLAARQIPYMIAVTPQPSFNPIDPDEKRTRQLNATECSILQRIAEEGGAIGLHGVTHCTRMARPHSEFMGLDDTSFEERVLYGDLELQRLSGVRPEVFVPPFNRVSARQIEILAKRFRIVCGGPETTAIIGAVGTHRLSDRSTYLPSYPPLYGRAHEIADALAAQPPEDVTCLTLHWEWERRRGYAELERLCDLIQGRVNDWSAWRDTPTV